MHIQKTNNRPPRKKNATIKVLFDKNNLEEEISIQDGTDTPIIPKCEADMNLIILIGLLHWRLGMALLLAGGADASTITVNANGDADQQEILAPVSDAWIIRTIIIINYK